jgi:hypothetical protein
MLLDITMMTEKKHLSIKFDVERKSLDVVMKWIAAANDLLCLPYSTKSLLSPFHLKVMVTTFVVKKWGRKYIFPYLYCDWIFSFRFWNEFDWIEFDRKLVHILHILFSLEITILWELLNGSGWLSTSFNKCTFSFDLDR